MFVKLSCLGALVVVLARAAVTAAPAMAASHDFKAGLQPSEQTYILTGEPTVGSNTTFKFGSGATMTCGVTKLEKTVFKEEEKNVTVEPIFEKCTLSGLAATIDSPCPYRISGQTDSFGHSRVTVECNNMKITVNGCTVEIEGIQETEQGMHWEEVEGSKPKDIRGNLTYKGGVYKEVGLLCASLVGGTGTDLSVTGSYTFKAYKDVLGGAEGEQIDYTTVETH